MSGVSVGCKVIYLQHESVGTRDTCLAILAVMVIFWLKRLYRVALTTENQTFLVTIGIIYKSKNLNLKSNPVNHNQQSTVGFIPSSD